ncbi:TetR/AcrR family transcriptional regulator [Acholeplasma equirhinis]|uniref:TetR/AcrR family transcriptional regulator n=1 Tax=Acholeplasma equirhinis TaxID=555393 RepID=UPI00197ACD66|nr:TetR/AcrR family transcriptional regulator [Acholeplasma equirhinis]MBN3491138.1 TetR/AcrR family transcriptional regulator [Acholeplasma equirhinis]
MSTKELIYQNAIELFSTHGYNNLGMRDLAKSVGIKASSIYNHYKSKEDILMDIAASLIKEMAAHVYPLFKRTDLSPRQFFTNVSIETNNFFEQPNIQRLTRLLMPLQFQIERLRQLIHLEFVQKPRGAYGYYFKSLMDKGLMRKDDPVLAAKMYHSFFVYHFYERFLDENPDGFLIRYELLFRNHINLFMDYFQIQD